MYSEHPIFESIEDNKKLWRYMDFTKFIDLLERQSLFFTRADKFEDKFEGSYSKFNRQIGREVYKNLTDEQYDNFMNQKSLHSKNMIRYTLINCWHINEYESDAMWKLYSKSNESVAIQTTFKNLKQAFDNQDEKIYIGKIKYIDYEKDWLPEGNVFSPFLHKRKSFEHEQELRAIIQRLPIEGEKVVFERDICEFGIPIHVDINILIEKVYVSPVAPQWFFELVEKVLKTYGYNKEVIYSKLIEEPFY